MVAIERNQEFFPELQAIGDSRLRVIHGDVKIMSAHLHELGLPRIDAVVSSIPFSFFPSLVRALIVRNTYDALAPNGKFIVYQYSPLMLRYLKERFSSVRVRFEPRNIPPYFIMIAEK